MKRFRCHLPSAGLSFVITAITMLLASSFALGQPMTYTGFVITDGQLGAWQFHNARVMLTFESDTKYAQTLDDACVGTTAVFNSTGVARVTIVDHERVVTAKLDPRQIFVSFDQEYGGVGFGSFAPGPPFVAASCSNPAALQPGYPLALHHGTMDNAGNTSNTGVSANQEAFPNNLQGRVGFSGTGYSCIGVPRLDCVAATAPLTTDHGDLYLWEPYRAFDSSGPGYLASINGAFFFQEPAGSGIPLPASVLASSANIAHRSITYHMFLVSDVSLNGQLYQNASIHLSFRSRISGVTPLAGAGPNSAINTHGAARVDIKQGGHTVTANFAPGQIYVYFDSSPASPGIGFGSFSGGRVYPAALAPTYVHLDTELFAAVVDILNGGSTYYTPETAELAQSIDLKHETMLAEYVSSCTDFDFSLGTCNNLPNSLRLRTDKGDFYLYEPYNANGFNDPTSLVRSSNNWGVFWTSFDADE